MDDEMIIDTDLEADEYSTVCTFCRHLEGKLKCKAFTGKIPLEIWNGSNDHRQPFPGDNGIQFEPKP